jgi:putative FmdB family regulatory protein
MPLYEFDCRACERPFEKRVSYAAIDQVICPTCGSSQVKKKLSLFSAPVKGQRGSQATAAPDCAPGGL